jgi:hypothetical protein
MLEPLIPGRVLLPVTSPTSSAFPKSRQWVGFPNRPAKRLRRRVFRDRRYSLRSGLLVCSPPRSPLPLRRSSPRRAAVTFTPEQKICTVTSTGIGHASRPNQAIDGKRTSTFLDLQPCRPLSRDAHPTTGRIPTLRRVQAGIKQSSSRILDAFTGNIDERRYSRTHPHS